MKHTVVFDCYFKHPKGIVCFFPPVSGRCVLHLLIVADSEVHALEEQLRQEEEPHISWDICINKKAMGQSINLQQ